jgi:hypothetical protein
MKTNIKRIKGETVMETTTIKCKKCGNVTRKTPSKIHKLILSDTCKKCKGKKEDNDGDE